MLLSCVIPCYDEEENILPFFQAIEKALTLWSGEYELIFVDDGSHDGTLRTLENLYDTASDRVQVISFTRNFGKEAALLAGLRRCSGRYTALIDADLQQRPIYVAQMLAFLEEHPEYDEVVACQEQRHEGRLLSVCKALFYRISHRLTGLPFVSGGSDFRVFRRNVREAILSLPERKRFSKGIFAWLGFPTYQMPYQVEDRVSGVSKWSVKSLLGYALHGIASFSTDLLLLPLASGLFLSGLAILLALFLGIFTAVGTLSLSGIGWLALLFLFLAGLQLQGVGVAAFYLGQLFTETKGRPLYIERLVLSRKDDAP